METKIRNIFRGKEMKDTAKTVFLCQSTPHESPEPKRPFNRATKGKKKKMMAVAEEKEKNTAWMK